MHETLNFCCKCFTTQIENKVKIMHIKIENANEFFFLQNKHILVIKNEEMYVRVAHFIATSY
jgi:hypothetical protein